VKDVAIHETGHWIAAIAYDVTWTEISITRERDWDGCLDMKNPREPGVYLKVLVGGMVAEEVFNIEISYGSRIEWDEAVEDYGEQATTQAMKEVLSLINSNRKTFLALTDELIHKQVIRPSTMSAKLKVETLKLRQNVAGDRFGKLLGQIAQNGVG